MCNSIMTNFKLWSLINPIPVKFMLHQWYTTSALKITNIITIEVEKSIITNWSIYKYNNAIPVCCRTAFIFKHTLDDCQIHDKSYYAFKCIAFQWGKMLCHIHSNAAHSSLLQYRLFLTVVSALSAVCTYAYVTPGPHQEWVGLVGRFE